MAGNGTAGYSGDGGPALQAEMYDGGQVALDGAGNLYIADYANNAIRKVDAGTGIISTVVGNGYRSVITSSTAVTPAMVVRRPAQS